jgi:hypothetical protein
MQGEGLARCVEAIGYRAHDRARACPAPSARARPTKEGRVQDEPALAGSLAEARETDELSGRRRATGLVAFLSSVLPELFNVVV